MGSGALASGMTDDAVPIDCPKRHELASSNVDRKRDRYSKRKYRGQFWNRKELSFFFLSSTNATRVRGTYGTLTKLWKTQRMHNRIKSMKNRKMQ